MILERDEDVMKIWRTFGTVILLSMFIASALAVPISDQWKGSVLRSPRHADYPQGVTRTVNGIGGTLHTIAVDSSHTYDVQHMDIYLEPNLEDGLVDGVVEMTAESEEEGLTELDVFFESGTINSIEVNESNVEFSRSGDVVTVTLATAFALEEEFTLSIDYSADFYPTSDYDGGMQYSVLSDVLYTFGEPYGTRRWMPCYDLPFDKVTSTVTTVLDSDYDVVSNGVLTSVEDLGEGLSRTVWTNSDPISTYLISICAASYTRVSADPAGVNDTEINFWVYPDQEEEMTYDFGRTGEIIELYESLFGPYPFNRYDQVVAPIFGGWGGMEHQTCTTFGSRLVGDGQRTYETVIAHELGHQWWGDWVGPVDFGNMWLNEGFATYTEILWAEYQSTTLMLSTITDMRASYMREDERARFPIYDPPYDPENGVDYLFSATTYEKGALILHMLRWVMGDEVFFAGMQLYGQHHAFGSANTQEFQADMEESSGLDLSSFFNEWIYGQGFPEYRISDFEVFEDEELGNSARFTISQTQHDAPYFSTSLPFMLRAGEQDTLVSIPMEAVLSQEVEVNHLDFLPSGFTFDPYTTILCTYTLNGVPEEETLPRRFQLSQAWPNPFNASTNLRITLLYPHKVRLEVFDLLGRQVGVVDRGLMIPGVHTINWQPDARLGSGTYLLRINVDDEHKVRRAILVK